MEKVMLELIEDFKKRILSRL